MKLTMDKIGEWSETNVSPDEQSTPNKAQISPDDVSWISCNNNTCEVSTGQGT